MADLSYSTLRRVTRLLIEWQLHTMVHSNESATAKWADIDIENACWGIPGDVMTMNKPHIVPLTSQTLTILEGVKPVSADNDYIFPVDRNLKGHANIAFSFMLWDDFGGRYLESFLNAATTNWPSFVKLPIKYSESSLYIKYLAID